jgi:hypothetical protein
VRDTVLREGGAAAAADIVVKRMGVNRSAKV